MHCVVDANPEPDIRWLHQFNNPIEQEIDLSDHSHQMMQLNQHHRRGNPTWSIYQEQINNTRWQTTLTIKVIQVFRQRSLEGN
jgi:hypothetical protein